MNYKDIQNEVIKKYRIDLCDGTRCKAGRMIKVERVSVVGYF